jgi:hypothetical protein
MGWTGGGEFGPMLTSLPLSIRTREHDGSSSVVGALQQAQMHTRRAIWQTAGAQPRAAAEALSAVEAMRVVQHVSVRELDCCNHRFVCNLIFLQSRDKIDFPCVSSTIRQLGTSRKASSLSSIFLACLSSFEYEFQNVQ